MMNSVLRVAGDLAYRLGLIEHLSTDVEPATRKAKSTAASNALRCALGEDLTHELM